jgi:hypothetical protein
MTISNVTVTDTQIVLLLSDGSNFKSPLSLYPTLQKASDRQQFKIAEQGRGVHWSGLNFSLSLEGMLAGRPEYQRSSKLPA